MKLTDIVFTKAERISKDLDSFQKEKEANEENYVFSKQEININRELYKKVEDKYQKYIKELKKEQNRLDLEFESVQQ